LDVEIFAYVRTLDGDEFMKVQQDLFLSIMDAVQAAGTALALPTQASVNYGSSSEPAPRANGSRSPLAPDRFARQS
jgi:MscS family membrane protein